MPPNTTSTYDFFEGMTESEITAFQASAGFGHKPTWRFGGGPVGAAGRAAGMNNPKSWRGARDWLYNGQVRRGTSPGRSANARACRFARWTKWACRTMPRPRPSASAMARW